MPMKKQKKAMSGGTKKPGMSAYKKGDMAKRKKMSMAKGMKKKGMMK